MQGFGLGGRGEAVEEKTGASRIWEHNPDVCLCRGKSVCPSWYSVQ